VKLKVVALVSKPAVKNSAGWATRLSPLNSTNTPENICSYLTTNNKITFNNITTKEI
jgi:hypothetical protein